MKNMKFKLLISVMALACAAVLATTTTFAWFSMSATATVTNLEMGVTSEGDLRISTRNTNNYKDYASWGYTVSMASWNFLLSPTTVNDSTVNNADTGGKDYVTDGNGNLNFELHNHLDATTSQYLKQELYFASLDEFEITMAQTLSLLLDDDDDFVMSGQGSSSATKYHYVISEVGSGDAARDELFRVEFNYTAPRYGLDDDDDLTIVEDEELGYRVVSAVNYSDLTPTYAGGTGDYTPITLTPLLDQEGNDIGGTFTITVNEKNIAGTFTRPPLQNDYNPDPAEWVHEDFLNSDVMLNFASTDEGYNPGDVIEVYNALNALRIGLVHHTVGGSDVVYLYDPHAGKGWSAYTTLNMAHETYSADWATGVIRVEGATPMTTSPKFTLEDTYATTTGGSVIYGAHITLYIWLEGTDADCMNAIAGYTIAGSLAFNAK